MKQTITLSCFLLIVGAVVCSAQIRLDSTLDFQTDPAKKFSLYIPSGYDGNTPIALMLGLHPFNTLRWDGKAWCDTLVDFAERNSLLLVCPDGGTDGAIDDQIDTAFATYLITKVEEWYNVDSRRMYVMGFSVGGRTAYTYGLANGNRFGGLIPIGAAINNFNNDVSDEILLYAENKPFYLVHGAFDSPNTRYFPPLEALPLWGGIVNSVLLDGVGHTIDFDGRNDVFSEAYRWIDSVNRANLPVSVRESASDNPMTVTTYPNPVRAGDMLSIASPLLRDAAADIRVNVYTALGVKAFGGVIAPTSQSQGSARISTAGLSAGTYYITLSSGAAKQTGSFVIW